MQKNILHIPFSDSFSYIGAKGKKGIQSWRLRRRLRTTAKKHTELASVELNCFGIKLHVGVQGTNLQEFKATLPDRIYRLDHSLFWEGRARMNDDNVWNHHSLHSYRLLQDFGRTETKSHLQKMNG